MKKTIAIALSIAAALCIFSCAKDPRPGANDANKRYFEAWLHVNYPDAKPTGLGIYILEEEVGTKYAVADSGCAFVNYIVRDLEGNITSYNTKETAKQMGTYDTTTYYGPLLGSHQLQKKQAFFKQVSAMPYLALTEASL